MAYYYSPFRKKYDADIERTSSCVFCDSKVLENQTIRQADGAAVENEHCLWVVNAFPKFEGHTMLVPKRHITEIAEESDEEVLARHELLKEATRRLLQVYPGKGIEVFLQTGPESESSVPHLHWHVVPASLTDPFRGFEKLGHFFTAEEGEERVVAFPAPIELAGSDLIDRLRSTR